MSKLQCGYQPDGEPFALSEVNGEHYMSTLDILQDQHKKLIGLFRQLETIDLRAPEMKKGVVHETFREINAYLKVEDQVLKPEFPDLEAAPDYARLNSLMTELRAMNPDQGGFDSKLDELIPDVELHMHEVEKILSNLDEEQSSRLKQLQDKVVLLYKELSGVGRDQASDPAHAQNPNGGEQSRKSA